jgi:signal transduction histidine kinase
MYKKLTKFTEDARLSTPVASVIFLRIFIKVLLFLSAVYFNLSYASLFIIIFIFLISEVYRNIGTILSASKKFPDEAIGAIVSAVDGAIIILLLFYTNLLGTYLFLFIILSIAFDTIEYGISGALAESLVASISYAFIESFTSNNYGAILTTAFIIIFIGVITGWLSEKLKNSEKLLNNTLMKSKENHKLDLMKNEFIGISSHKVKTPISVIEGYIELMLNERVGQLNQEQKNYLTKIDINTRKLDTLLTDLLSILTLQNNKIMITPSENYIYSFLEDIKNDFKAEEKITKLKYEEDVNVGDKKLAIFDSDKLKTALSNILMYSFDKARTSVVMNSYIDNHTWVIDIKDDSMGISKNEVRRILSNKNDVFNTIRDLGDKGLNLYISHLIIESHKGVFEIISIEGVGTTFKIKIPI